MIVSFDLPIKPLSVNAAFQGRRFKTKEAKQYDRALQLMIPKRRCEGEYYSISFWFHLRNFGGTDYDNLIKLLQDNIVKKGVITDDRKIVEAHIYKVRARVDKIAVKIASVNE